ncbi:hypothetical protein ACFXPS_41825 [Nocardia sp. NPDC059091]|uniref:hypothetical protein n=1 Tax=unclassified Nocardia TaxID=2637762 RepID=UPI00368145E8
MKKPELRATLPRVIARAAVIAAIAVSPAAAMAPAFAEITLDAPTSQDSASNQESEWAAPDGILSPAHHGWPGYGWRDCPDYPGDRPDYPGGWWDHPDYPGYHHHRYPPFPPPSGSFGGSGDY